MLQYFSFLSLLALATASASLYAQDEPVLDLAIQKSVNDPIAIENQLIEFTVEVSNVGDLPATDVVARDSLPAGLVTPEGLAVSTSVGLFDPNTGLWQLGNVEVGQSETMIVPAILSADSQSACIVNNASMVSLDSNSANNYAAVAIKKPDIAQCVDLYFDYVSGPTQFPFCGLSRLFRYTIAIVNRGTDDALNVVLTISETRDKAPGFVTNSPGCADLQCSWDTILAGERRVVDAASITFTNSEPLEHEILATICSSSEDYDPDNNTVTQGGTILPFLDNCVDFSGLDSGLGSGGPSGCFIATAAYGTPFDERIDRLRRFRDSTLVDYHLGRKLTEWYYSYSPPIADYIATRPFLQAVARFLLVPVLWAISYPIVTLLAGVICILLLLFWWIRYFGTRPDYPQ